MGREHRENSGKEGVAIADCVSDLSIDFALNGYFCYMGGTPFFHALLFSFVLCISIVGDGAISDCF